MSIEEWRLGCGGLSRSASNGWVGSEGVSGKMYGELAGVSSEKMLEVYDDADEA